MATDIFDKGFSDHVVFDRIVDVDRTIILARQAADKAEAAGQPEKAAKLREKADYLEEILNNTQNPDYSDEEEGTPPSSQDAGDRGGTSKSSGKNSGQDGSAAEEPDESEGTDNGDTEENEETDSQEGGSGSGNEEQKQPEDIADLDQHNGSHASGTNQHKGGGPSGGSDGGGGGSESNSGESNPKNQGKGQGKGNGQNQELDPFRVKKVQGQSQQKQPTKEEILAAIIKRLSGLSGDAKKGADRALQDYFNDISGGGSL